MVSRLKERAKEHGVSLNEYITLLARAVTDPDLATTDGERLRERLAVAGLLAPAGRQRQRPDPDDVADARQIAGQGTSLSTLVSEGR